MTQDELKKHVTNAIKGFGSRSYTRILTLSYPALAEELKKTTAHLTPKNLNESIYILLNGEPTFCHKGNKPLFASYELGYKSNCGKAAVCECAKSSQQAKLVEWHENLTEEEKSSRIEKTKNTSLEKYGTNFPAQNVNVQQKIKNTNLERYGAESPFQSAEIQQKIKDTNIEKYGVETPFQREEIQIKAKQTTIDRYGKSMTHARATLYDLYDGKNPFTDNTVKEKRTDTMLSKYGTTHALQNKEVFDKMMQSNIEKYGRPNVAQNSYSDELWEILSNPVKFLEIAKDRNAVQVGNDIGASSDIVLRYARKYNVLDQMKFDPLSAMEDDLKEWLISQNIPFQQHNRSILPGHKEIDFYFDDIKVGIELNSLQIHSELAGGKDIGYHLQKHKGCEIKGIQLLQFWQDEYWCHKQVVQSKILYLHKRITNKIYARDVIITPIEDIEQERKFLQANHIQGSADYAQKRTAAWHDGKLVAVMGFAQNNGRMELVRFATDITIVSAGLFTRMFEFSVKHFKLSGKIVSLSDNRVSNGNLYLQSGWTYDGEIGPNYCYTGDYYTREHKQGFMKGKLTKRFNLDPEYVSAYTEWEIVSELGFDRLWDVGKRRWIMMV